MSLVITTVHLYRRAMLEHVVLPCLRMAPKDFAGRIVKERGIAIIGVLHAKPFNCPNLLCVPT